MFHFSLFSLPIALVCAFLLGFSDSCFETQLYQFIATNYTEDSSPPFAICQSLQAIAMGSMYFFSNHMGLNMHVFTLTIGASVGTLAFLAADRASREDQTLADEAIEKPSMPSQRPSLSSQFSITPVGILGKGQGSRPSVISVDIVG